ncbi:MAG: NDP-hexose 2,3-dehydratase family protein [Polyangiaceae bacterium]|nr:NDP-hexose 2,3-dehydratase family protein [Polyangiaceae bacterium]
MTEEKTVELSAGMSLLHSALSPRREVRALLDWLEKRKRAAHFEVRSVGFSELDLWSFDGHSGRLGHRSGRFFSIGGLRVSTNFGPVAAWDQPIIHQPEIGILGILTKRRQGTRHFLMQAKVEPGNVNGVQLSPTVQATRSNYTRVHQGKRPPYLEYFLEPGRAEVLVDQLQSEQGSRFFRKQNRNMMVEVREDVAEHEDFCWLTLSEIKALLAVDDVVNMDARTVLACVSYADEALEGYYGDGRLESSESLDFFGHSLAGFQKDLLGSMLARRRGRHSSDEILSWFSSMRCAYELSTETIPLDEVEHWVRTDREIRHETGRFFSVVAVAVEAGTREVTRWTQPLLKHEGVGLAGFLVQRVNGIIHFLVRACVEPGSFDVIDLGPTVACAGTRSPRQHAIPLFYELFMDAAPGAIRYDAVQSEEGGRFLNFRNRYMIVELDAGATLEFPENYRWMTLGQILEFTRVGFFNIEARNLVACLGAT